MHKSVAQGQCIIIITSFNSDSIVAPNEFVNAGLCFKIYAIIISIYMCSGCKMTLVIILKYIVPVVFRNNFCQFFADASPILNNVTITISIATTIAKWIFAARCEIHAHNNCKYSSSNKSKSFHS